MGDVEGSSLVSHGEDGHGVDGVRIHREWAEVFAVVGSHIDTKGWDRQLRGRRVRSTTVRRRQHICSLSTRVALGFAKRTCYVVEGTYSVRLRERGTAEQRPKCRTNSTSPAKYLEACIFGYFCARLR